MPLQRVLKILSVCFLAALFVGCGSGDDRTYPSFTSFQNNDAPVRLQFLNVPQRAAGTPFGTINVAVKDFNGITVATDTRPVTLSLTNPNGATLSGTTTVNAVNGVASFSGLSVDTPGTYTFTATAQGLLPAESGSFSITTGPPAQITYIQQPPPADPLNPVVKGVPISPAVSVEVRDQFGNLVDNVTVTVVAGVDPTGTTTLSGTQAVTVNGIATFPNLTVETGGGAIVLAAASGSGLAIADPTFVTGQLDIYAIAGLANFPVVRGQVFPPPAAVPAPIGALGPNFNGVGGLIAHPNGNLFALARDLGNVWRLLELSPTNATVINNTVITGTDGTAFTGLTIDPATETMYTYIPNGTNVGLHSINRLTGAVTFIGSSGLANTGEGVAWEPFAASPVIFTGGGAAVDGLSVLDPATGAGTQVAAAPTLAITDMTVNPFDTNLYATEPATGLYTLNKTTGVSTGPQPGSMGLLSFTFRIIEP